LREVLSTHPVASVSAAEVPTPVNGEVRPERVLLAEDNPVNQRLASKMLEKLGHTVTIANNGNEAVTLFQQQSFDIIFMDVQMPEMDGMAATAAIRQLEQGSSQHIPIVALTARAMKGDRQACLAAGMDGYLSKPFKAEALIRTIRQVWMLAGQTMPTPLMELLDEEIEEVE
jgi:CheY-like chemotaxis protein